MDEDASENLRLRCRLGRMSFADYGLVQPCFADVLDSRGRCFKWCFPNRPGAPSFALSGEDIAANDQDELAVDDRNMFRAICSQHAEVFFERAVKARVCMGPALRELNVV